MNGQHAGSSEAVNDEPQSQPSSTNVSDESRQQLDLSNASLN